MSGLELRKCNSLGNDSSWLINTLSFFVQASGCHLQQATNFCISQMIPNHIAPAFTKSSGRRIEGASSSELNCEFVSSDMVQSFLNAIS